MDELLHELLANDPNPISPDSVELLAKFTWDEDCLTSMGREFAAKLRIKDKINPVLRCLFLIEKLLQRSNDINPAFITAVSKWKPGFVSMQKKYTFHMKSGREIGQNVRILCAKILTLLDILEHAQSPPKVAPKTMKSRASVDQKPPMYKRDETESDLFAAQKPVVHRVNSGSKRVAPPAYEAPEYRQGEPSDEEEEVADGNRSSKPTFDRAPSFETKPQTLKVAKTKKNQPRKSADTAPRKKKVTRLSELPPAPSVMDLNAKPGFNRPPSVEEKFASIDDAWQDTGKAFEQSKGTKKGKKSSKKANAQVVYVHEPTYGNNTIIVDRTSRNVDMVDAVLDPIVDYSIYSRHHHHVSAYEVQAMADLGSAVGSGIHEAGKKIGQGLDHVAGDVHSGFESVAHGAGHAFDAISASEVGSGVGHAFSAVGSAVGDAAGAVGDALGSVVGGLGDALGAIAGIFNPFN